MEQIDLFITKLAARKSSERVFNPYENPKLAENLNKYLSFMLENSGKRILLVGEAPGYKGCRLTGIPFSSGAVIRETPLGLFKKIGKDIAIKKIESENTAKIVWEFLDGKRHYPLFWNSFPFHPHPKGNPEKNRAPTREEIREGMEYLKELMEIFEPKIIAGVGRAGEHCSSQAFPYRKITYIRHPSYGGKTDFLAGMKKLFERKINESL